MILEQLLHGPLHMLLQLTTMHWHIGIDKGPTSIGSYGPSSPSSSAAASLSVFGVGSVDFGGGSILLATTSEAASFPEGSVPRSDPPLSFSPSSLDESRGFAAFAVSCPTFASTLLVVGSSPLP